MISKKHFDFIKLQEKIHDTRRNAFDVIREILMLKAERLKKIKFENRKDAAICVFRHFDLEIEKLIGEYIKKYQNERRIAEQLDRKITNLRNFG